MPVETNCAYFSLLSDIAFLLLNFVELADSILVSRKLYIEMILSVTKKCSDGSITELVDDTEDPS